MMKVNAKKGFFIIEVVLYLMILLLLSQYLFCWLEALVNQVQKMTINADAASNSIFARISFLKIVNNAPERRDLWLSMSISGCNWKIQDGTAGLYYKNGSLIQKTHSNESGITTRLVLLNNINEGEFHFFSKGDTVKRVGFSYRINGEDYSPKEGLMLAKTRRKNI